MGALARGTAIWAARILSVLLLLCSLLVLVSAPTAWLWVVAIVIAEWGHFAALLGIALAVVAALWGGRSSNITAAVALLAAALCALPAVRAAMIAQSLPARCTEAFGAAQGRAGDPFSVVALFSGLPTADVEVTEHGYAHKGRKELKLDLYRAGQTAGAATPLIVMVHGGSWSGGNKNELPDINRYLARQGFAVASINYRHAPKRPFPAAVDDVFRAIEFLRRNAAELRLDASHIVLIGRSAGGQIALSAAYAGRDPAIRGVVSFYGPTDVVLGYNHPSRRGVLDSQHALEQYLGGSPAEQPDRYAVASPVNHVSAGTPPTLLIHGALDPIVWPEHSELLAEKLADHKVPHLYLQLPWATHGCEANLSGPSGQLSMYAVEHFLATILRDR